MKNVRLFAVAAAMGMFASTVAAAEPAAKTAYVGTWGEMTEIVKVDIGNKVVAPTATIKVVKETRTTDKSEVKTADGTGFQLYPTCYAGYTNEEAIDDNLDGWVDTDMLFHDFGKGWLTTDAKFYPSAKTAMYYIGATDGSGSLTGGWFLAPGAAEKEIYASDLLNKHFADEDAVFAWLEEEGKIHWNYDLEGDIASVTVNAVSTADKDGNPTGDYELRLVVDNNKKIEDKLVEAVVELFTTGNIPAGISKQYVKKAYNTASQSELTYKANLDADDELEPLNANTYYVAVYNKRKDTYSLEVATSSDLVQGKLWDASGKAIELTPGYITIVVENQDSDDDVNVPVSTASDAAKTEVTSYSRFSTIKMVKNAKYAAKSAMYWDEELAGFVEYEDGFYSTGISNATTVTGFYWGYTYNAVTRSTPRADQIDGILNVPAHAMGLLKVETVENDTDMIVLAHPSLRGENAELSVKDETYTYDITFDVNDGITTGGAAQPSKITVKAVRLEDGWYPAVATEEELVKVVSYVSGLGLIGGYYEDRDGDLSNGKEKSGAFGDWASTTYPSAYINPITGVKPASSRTLADGTKETIYSPANALQNYTGTFCTYSVEGTEEVNATITSDAASIDTTTAGIKTLTYTAKVGEEVVGTKEIKVVVAPNYERVYKNGKVVKLTAKWLNGNTYAVYNYDWAAKTFTATFYEEDGVTVASTTNGTL